MLRKFVIIGGFGLLLIPAIPLPANAQSGQQDAWTGFSVSVGGGAARTDASLDATTSNQDVFTIDFLPVFLLELIAEGEGQSSAGIDDWEGFGTLQAGYDFRSGNFVLGVLGDYDFYPGDPGGQSSDSIDGNFTINLDGLGGPASFGPFPFADYASVTSSLRFKDVWSVGGRLGYLVTPSMLIYGLGGYTEASVEGQVDLSYSDLTGDQTLSLRASDELRGYFIGGGGEVLVDDNIALRLEYRYANYNGEMSSTSDSSGFSFPAGPGTVSYANNASVKSDLDAQIHSIRGAVVLKLGEP
jgi:outer membrane immunogenic protein